MTNIAANPFNRKKLTKDVLKRIECLLDVDHLRCLTCRPGLITRVDGEEIEILLSSEYVKKTLIRKGTRHVAGEFRIVLSAYSEEQGARCRSYALLDPEWKDNPARCKLHMISYVGMPI